jgi:hypothetical protein
MRSGSCWFDRCLEPGMMVNLDGAHPRSLCDKHLDEVRRTLAIPDDVRIDWGSSPKAASAQLGARLPSLVAAYEAAEEAVAEHEPPMFAGMDDDEGARLDEAVFTAWERLREIEQMITLLRTRTRQHPIVRTRRMG